MSLQNKKTSPLMTKFEYTRILGVRAMQISRNAPVMIDNIEKYTDPIKIAEKEIQCKKIPLIIRRNLPNGLYEDWNINDMIVPNM
tara:strand:- start:11 stop:265 length:255 start_codon:yes stop_codon:yes gene_type:complete